MTPISIFSVPGFLIGNAEDVENGTGCTAILCKGGAVGGVDVRGGGPATRDTDLLDPKNTVEQVHGVLLGGGSAFGLCAATGVMEHLAGQGVGFPVTPALSVPIVVQADIFDLGVGNAVWPDVDMGRRAAENAEKNHFQSGNHGAGTGASIGKLLGAEWSTKSGLGAAAFQSGDLMVGAVVVVNACGEVFRMDSPEKLGGVRREWSWEEISGQSGTNTTIGCVLTNGTFSKGQMEKLAAMAQNGLVRTIRPVNMTLDGDTMFALASCEVPASLDAAGELAVHAVAKAVEDAVLSAKSAYGLPGADCL